jgi:hypothetical protein
MVSCETSALAVRKVAALGVRIHTLLLLLIGASWTCSAQADPVVVVDPNNPYFVPDTPAAPSFPDLTHRGTAINLETTFASIKPHDGALGAKKRSFAMLGRTFAEVTLANRRWYAGVAEEFAYGQAPGGTDGRFLYGNPEIWLRAMWASRAGIAYGGGLELVAPLFRQSADSPEALTAQAVRVVRPWQFSSFAENTFTVRPFIDARIINGPVILQLRQAFELQGIVAEARIPKSNVVSRTTFFVGYQPIDELSLGIEFWEVYFVSASEVQDDLRAVFAVSPSIRYMAKVFQPAISGIFPFERPLFDSVESYWGIRLSLGFVIE